LQLKPDSSGSERAMESSDVLLTIAEIAAAFAGFSSVITVFQDRAGVKWKASEAQRFWQVLFYSLCALFVALVPVLCEWFGLTGSTIWSVSSLALGAAVAGTVSAFLSQYSRLEPAEQASFRPLPLSVGPSILVVIMLLANGAGWPFEASRGPFLLGLVWLLFLAALSFARLLLVRFRAGR
jgi:hypothetical protein